MPVAARRLILVAALVLGACTPSVSPAPAATELAQVVPADVVVGCASIEAAECAFVTARIVAALPEGRRAPFSIQISLFGCGNNGPCAKSLGARPGRAIVEYANGGEPIQLRLAGPPVAPQIEIEAGTWSEAIQPSSARVQGSGPFEFEVGHCGLSHVVDFDGSFWVFTGPVDGEAQAFFNSERGIVGLVAANLAEYRGTDNSLVRLARFPGAKRFFLCD